MKRGWIIEGVLIALLAAVPVGAQSTSPGTELSGAGKGQAAAEPHKKDLVKELKVLQDGLPAKESELARLRHRWVISKGRNPTKKEVEVFEKKRQKGATTVEDNPYVNKSPLYSVASRRAEYYQKLEEIKRDKEAIRILEQQLGR